MSSGIIWYAKEDNKYDTIWAVTDTLYKGKNTKITEYGPKLFEISIICNHPKQENPNILIPYFKQNIGFAVAGSAIAALCTYATTCNLLSKLVTVNNELPSLETIYEAINKIAFEYRTPIYNNLPFEFALLGYCHIHKRNEVFHTQIPIKDAVKRNFLLLTDRDHFLFLGAHKDEIMQRIIEYRDGIKDKHIIWNDRAPISVLNEIVKNCIFDNIGGAISIGSVIAGNFELFTVVDQSKEYVNKFTLSLYNHDILHRINPIGNFNVFPKGILI